MESTYIRPYNTKDSVGVKALITSILDNEFGREKDLYPTSDLDNISISYGGHRDIFYVLVDNDKIIGTIAIKEDDRNTALLRRVFVDTVYRGRGLGLQLLKKAIDFCIEKKYSQIVFRSTDRMVSAIGLCKKSGFVERAHLAMGDIDIYKFTLNLDNIKNYVEKGSKR